jgi:hypothetical protein
MPPEAEDVVAEAAAAESVVDGPVGDAPTEDEPVGGAPTEDAVLLFVGGPLDGRVEIRPARQGEPLPTVTHVHLHDGPKVVHRYDLQPLAEQAGIYTVRPRENPGSTDSD